MAKRTKLLAEEVEYVVAQRNMTLARRTYTQLKKSGTATEEQLELAEMRLAKAKEKATSTSAILVRAGLSKGSI
jgi:hypothetical protein